MILGLDISTTCTGIAIARSEGTYEASAVRLTSKKLVNWYDKADLLRRKLSHIHTHYDITGIAIEKPATRMGRGMSSAHTLHVLSRFNGVISWICHDLFKLEPSHIDPRVARKRLGIAIPKGADAKTEVVQWLMRNKGFRVEYTRSGRISPKYFDAADALVMALAFKSPTSTALPPDEDSSE